MTDHDTITSTTDRDQIDNASSPMISSERVTGTNVYNAEGDKLGSIETVMIDKLSGQVRFAVMSFGGFLGIGEKYHQLPWDGLTYDESKAGYVVNISREGLQGAPSYGRDEVDSFDYGSESDSIDHYYGNLEGFYSPDQQSRRNSRTAGTGMKAGQADFQRQERVATGLDNAGYRDSGNR